MSGPGWLGGARALEDLTKNREHGSVLLAACGLLRSDDVGQTCDFDLKSFSQLLPCCAAPKVFISAGAVREERNVEIAVVRHKGLRGSPGEGVLVERELHWSLDARNTKGRVEFSKGGSKTT